MQEVILHNHHIINSIIPFEILQNLTLEKLIELDKIIQLSENPSENSPLLNKNSSNFFKQTEE